MIETRRLKNVVIFIQTISQIFLKFFPLVVLPWFENFTILRIGNLAVTAEFFKATYTLGLLVAVEVGVE